MHLYSATPFPLTVDVLAQVEHKHVMDILDQKLVATVASLRECRDATSLF